MLGPDEEEVDQDALAADWGADADEDEVNQDDVASEWEAMSDDDEEVQSTRVLNQDEIDNLLGFQDDDNYIVKPFNAATLKSKLVGVLGEF